MYQTRKNLFEHISKHREETVINASAAGTLLEQRPEKIQALSGIRTYGLCDAIAVLSQLSYQSHMRPGLCSSSVTVALALMTVSIRLLLMHKINFTEKRVKKNDMQRSILDEPRDVWTCNQPLP